MQAPRISVIMSVFDNAPFLAQAIESILAQTFGDFEFIIVDDGSRDGSGAIIAAFARQDARIIAIHQQNRGLVASLNRAIGTAQGEFLARMDGDDVSLPERFARQVSFLDTHSDYGVVGTQSEYIDEQGAAHGSLAHYPITHDDLVAGVDRGPLLNHPAVMMRRALVTEAGGYRAAFRHCEDYDLWLRLIDRTHIGNLPETLFRYRKYAGQVSDRHLTEQQIGAAIAIAAWHERQEGRPDPIGGLERLPSLDQADALFGRPGVAASVRARVAPKLLYSGTALAGAGFALLIDHVRDGGAARDEMWRVVARLMRMGLAARAARLAVALLRA